MVKSVKSQKKNAALVKRFRRNLFLIALSAFIIKIFVIARIQGFDWYGASNGDLAAGLGILLDNNFVPPNAWYGADGENYVRGLQGLANEGFFSQNDKLSYWPAGYPILLWPLFELFRGHFFFALSLLQSSLYALGSFWLVDEIRKTRVYRISYPLAFVLAFNPTLSLGTITVGYEAPVVSLTMIANAAILRYFLEKRKNIVRSEVFVASISFSIATFMQPRLLVIAVAFFGLWSFAKFRKALIAPFLVITIGIVVLAPSVLIFRNHETHGYPAVSTNLGITMRLGAGPGTSGGYSNRPVGLVECPESSGSPSEIDQALVRCVIDWYLGNPGRALELFWNKSQFFWSPWFGPEANGTMARNPWNQIHPLRSIINTENGFKLVYGILGKIVSWLWMLGGLVFLTLGFTILWRMGGLERLLASIAGSTFLLNLISAMLTIGDHRFRIPSMAMSLLLQVIGFTSLSRKKTPIKGQSELLVEWPAFQHKESKDSKP